MPTLARVADTAAGLALALGLWALITDGVDRRWIFSIGFSVRDPTRPILLALLIATVRHWYVPQHPLWRRLWRRLTATASEQHHLLGRFSAHPMLEFVGVSLGFAILVGCTTWPQAMNLYAMPDLGDPLFSIWRLAAIARQLAVDPAHLFDGNIFHPEPMTLTYSDAVLAPAILAAPFFWLGAPQAPVYTLLFLSGWVFSGVATYYFVRALTGRRGAAVVAGAAFAIYPYRSEHYSHLELQMTVGMPLTLWCLHRTFASGRLQDGLLTGLSYAFQALSSLYYGLFLAVYVIPVALTLWVHRGRTAAPIRALVAGGALAAVLLAPVAVAYTRSQPARGERSTAAVEYFSAEPADYLVPHFRSTIYGRWDAAGKAERQLLPGVVIIILALMGAWPGWSATRLGYLLAGAVAFDASLGLHGFTYPWLYELIGPFRNLRVPARFSILVGLTLAILAGYGVSRLLALRPGWRWWLPATCVLLLAIDMNATLSLSPIWRKPPPIYDVLQRAEPGVVAEFPVGRDAAGIEYDYRYMYFSTFHWKDLINGGSGNFPKSWEEFVSIGHDFPSEESIRYLRSRGVDYVIVHGGLYQDPERGEIIRYSLRHEPDFEYVGSSRFEGDLSTLYRLH